MLRRFAISAKSGKKVFWQKTIAGRFCKSQKRQTNRTWKGLIWICDIGQTQGDRRFVCDESHEQKVHLQILKYRKSKT